MLFFFFGQLSESITILLILSWGSNFSKLWQFTTLFLLGFILFDRFKDKSSRLITRQRIIQVDWIHADIFIFFFVIFLFWHTMFQMHFDSIFCLFVMMVKFICCLF